MSEEGKFSYTLKWACESDWTPAIRMVWKTFMKFEAPDYTKEGIKNFNSFLTDGDLYRLFIAGKYPILLALDGEKIIGFGSLRNGNFLSLLFVDEDYQKKGVGTALIGVLGDYLKKEIGYRVMTVRSSPVAIGFYEKIGFRRVGEEMQYSGIRVTPMEKSL